MYANDIKSKIKYKLFIICDNAKPIYFGKIKLSLKKLLKYK